MNGWPLPPKRFPALERNVQVWLVRANDDSVCLACCEELLSSAEGERASRFKFDKDRRLFFAAHGALRSILARYLNAAPADLQFDTGSNGKPYLSPAFAASAVKFNLSHSHEVALIAVTRGMEIGVDVERVREDFAFDEVAERFFTAKEVTALHSLPRHLQREGFYKCWTSKEAYLKAKGTGLSGQLDEVEIALAAGERVQINGTIPNWALKELSPCDGYQAGLVVEGGGQQIKCYHWQFPPAGRDHAHL